MPRGRRSGYNDDQQLSFDALWAEPEPARDEQVRPHGDAALGEDRPGPLPADPRVARGYGCPRCAVSRRAAARAGTFEPGRSLAVLHPDLAGELRDLDPGAVGPGFRTRAWWRCAACGHEWAATIKQRVAGHGCPRC